MAQDGTASLFKIADERSIRRVATIRGFSDPLDADTASIGFQLTMRSTIKVGQKGLSFSGEYSNINGPFYHSFNLVVAKIGDSWDLNTPGTVRMKNLGVKRLEAFVQKSDVPNPPGVATLRPAPDPSIGKGWSKYYIADNGYIKNVVFLGGQIVVDGTSYGWNDIVSGTPPTGWTRYDYQNNCTTVRYTPINGSPAWTTDVVARP